MEYWEEQQQRQRDYERDHAERQRVQECHDAQYRERQQLKFDQERWERTGERGAFRLQPSVLNSVQKGVTGTPYYDRRDNPRAGPSGCWASTNKASDGWLTNSLTAFFYFLLGPFLLSLFVSRFVLLYVVKPEVLDYCFIACILAVQVVVSFMIWHKESRRVLICLLCLAVGESCLWLWMASATRPARELDQPEPARQGGTAS